MITAAQLAAALDPVLGAVRVANLRVLSGGASRATWGFDAIGTDGRRSLIARIGAPDDLHAAMGLEASARQISSLRCCPYGRLSA